MTGGIEGAGARACGGTDGCDEHKSRRTDALRLVLVGGREEEMRVLAEVFCGSAPGWRLMQAASVDEALANTAYGPWDVALLSGATQQTALAACSRLRQQRLSAGIALLSETSTLDGWLAALDAGADDYLVPHRLTGLELCDRLRVAFLRRSRSTQSEHPVPTSSPLGKISIDREAGTILLDGRSLDVTKHQRLLLLRLAAECGAFVSAGDLCASAGIQTDPEFKNLRNQIWRLRKRLSYAGSLIDGMPKRGYRLAQ